MNERTQQLINAVHGAFESAFNYAATHVIQAPGRVNLIGEHTDYNDGLFCLARLITKPSSLHRNVMTISYEWWQSILIIK